MGRYTRVLIGWDEQSKTATVRYQGMGRHENKISITEKITGTGCSQTLTLTAQYTDSEKIPPDQLAYRHISPYNPLGGSDHIGGLLAAAIPFIIGVPLTVVNFRRAEDYDSYSNTDGMSRQTVLMLGILGSALIILGITGMIASVCASQQTAQNRYDKVLEELYREAAAEIDKRIAPNATTQSGLVTSHQITIAADRKVRMSPEAFLALKRAAEERRKIGSAEMKVVYPDSANERTPLAHAVV